MGIRKYSLVSFGHEDRWAISIHRCHLDMKIDEETFRDVGFEGAIGSRQHGTTSVWRHHIRFLEAAWCTQCEIYTRALASLLPFQTTSPLYTSNAQTKRSHNYDLYLGYPHRTISKTNLKRGVAHMSMVFLQFGKQKDAHGPIVLFPNQSPPHLSLSLSLSLSLPPTQWPNLHGTLFLSTTVP
jgi:hypothetical protein